MTTRFLASTREIGLFQAFDLPPKIETLYRAEFSDDGYVANQYQLDAALQLWLPTQAVADFVYLGEGALEYVNRFDIEAYLSNAFPEWAGSRQPGRLGLAFQLDALTEEHPYLVYDFEFAQWSKSPNDCAYFQVQVDSPERNSWWIEFSSDQFNNPALTEKQRRAIWRAGFDAPALTSSDALDSSYEMLHYSPNHHKIVHHASADQVVDLIRSVLIEGFDALGFSGLDDFADA